MVVVIGETGVSSWPVWFQHHDGAVSMAIVYILVCTESWRM